MSRSAAFALPLLHRFGVGFLVLRLKEKYLSQSKPRFDERLIGFGEYQSRGEHTALSHTFTNCWHRIILNFTARLSYQRESCLPLGTVTCYAGSVNRNIFYIIGVIVVIIIVLKVLGLF